MTSSYKATKAPEILIQLVENNAVAQYEVSKFNDIEDYILDRILEHATDINVFLNLIKSQKDFNMGQLKGLAKKKVPEILVALAEKDDLLSSFFSEEDHKEFLLNEATTFLEKNSPWYLRFLQAIYKNNRLEDGVLLLEKLVSQAQNDEQLKVVVNALSSYELTREQIDFLLKFNLEYFNAAFINNELNREDIARLVTHSQFYSERRFMEQLIDDELKIVVANSTQAHLDEVFSQLEPNSPLIFKLIKEITTSTLLVPRKLEITKGVVDVNKLVELINLPKQNSHSSLRVLNNLLERVDITTTKEYIAVATAINNSVFRESSTTLFLTFKENILSKTTNNQLISLIVSQSPRPSDAVIKRLLDNSTLSLDNSTFRTLYSEYYKDAEAEPVNSYRGYRRRRWGYRSSGYLRKADFLERSDLPLDILVKHFNMTKRSEAKKALWVRIAEIAKKDFPQLKFLNLDNAFNDPVMQRKISHMIRLKYKKAQAPKLVKESSAGIS